MRHTVQPLARAQPEAAMRKMKRKALLGIFLPILSTRANVVCSATVQIYAIKRGAYMRLSRHQHQHAVVKQVWLEESRTQTVLQIKILPLPEVISELNRLLRALMIDDASSS